MIHLALHFLVPAAIARWLFKPVFVPALLFMLAGIAIDIDHLLATPIYDPERCSIGFHPLHSLPACVFYVLLLLASSVRKFAQKYFGRYRAAVNLVSIGLCIHIFLDAADCLI